MTYVQTQVQGASLLIRMDRPERLNAMGTEMADGLIAALDRLDHDPELQVGIITGTGRAFTSGLDMKEQKFGAQGGAERVDAAMRNRAKPLITAVNGLCLGGGLRSLVMKTDIRIATRDAVFGMPEVKMGARATPYDLIAQGVPLAIATEMVMLGEPIDADRALAVGLINRIVSADELIPTAFAVAERLCTLNADAVQLIHQAGGFAREALEKAVRAFEPDIPAYQTRRSAEREAFMRKFTAGTESDS